MSNRKLIDVAHEYSLLKAKYEQEVRRHIESARGLSDDEFWPLVSLLVTKIISSKTHGTNEFVRSQLFNARHSVSNPIHYAMGAERKALRQEQAEAGFLTWNKLASFVRTYKGKKDEIYKKCFEMDSNKGDDSFGDSPGRQGDLYQANEGRHRYLETGMQFAYPIFQPAGEIHS